MQIQHFDTSVISTPSRITNPTAREQHETILFHCMILIEKPELNDGIGEICNMILLYQIDTIIDTGKSKSKL